jgi:hypothetical protein
MTINNLHYYYRISDKGNPLGRTELKGTYLESVTRRKCFNNFIDAFGIENLHVIADNCNDNTIEFIKSKGIQDIERTNFGNAGSFLYLIDRSIRELDDNEVCLSVEDDYLHTKDAKQYIFDGLEIGDYVSLYDSLDKYKDTDKGGYNPLIYEGGEDTKVLLGRSCHFKKTNSTTCSFATKVKTLKEDFEIIKKYSHPSFLHPYDFALFRELITLRGRILVCPLPGKSMHVGLEPSPYVNWEEIVRNLKEN